MAESKEFDLDALQALQNLTLGTNDVTRWQGTPQVHPYNVSTHAYNCAMLYMQLCFVCRKKMDARLLCTLLTHDNMESLTGDLLAPAKSLDENSWDSIEVEVQDHWRKDNKIYRTMSQAFVPIESDFEERMSPTHLRLLKIIDMLEFLLHALEEYRMGNRHEKIVRALKYGSEVLSHRINDFQRNVEDEGTRDIVTCVRYYFNRQLNDVALSGEFYV